MRTLLTGICLFVGIARPCFAQTFGEITGAVADSTGGVAVGATVTVTNPQTNITRSTITNSTGSYNFPALLPGVYSVRAEMQGFQSEVHSGVELQVQQVARINFQLKVGSVAETVEVTGGAPLLSTENATVGTVIDNQRIVELPLNGRNFIQLVALSPNVNANFANGGTASSRQGGDRSNQQISVAGMRREFNNYTLDGIANTDVNFNTYIFLPSIDALQEFKVQTGVYSAEFGRAAAQVNVSSKGGTNDYHGALFEFLRNNALDARPFGFTRVVPVSAPFKWNQYGFALGGPVRIPKLFNGRNRLFFMSNYEGFRLRREEQNVYSTAPVAMRRGDFSQVLPSTVIRDPQNRDAAGVKAPFAGNIIPTTRLHRIALGLLEFYPEPNLLSAGLTNNYLGVLKSTNDKDQFTQRIDFVETSNSNWFGRYSWQSEHQIQPGIKLNGTDLTVNVKQAMLSNVRVLSPSVVNEFRFGYSGIYNNLGTELGFKRDPVKELGIPIFPVEPQAWGTPAIAITGFSGFGDSANGPFVINNHAFQWVDNISWTRGTHALKFGAEIRRDRFNQVGNQNARSALEIQNQATGYGFSDYMLGYVWRTQDAAGLAISQFRATSQAYFVDDTWKVRPNLTISMGLRYEYTPPWSSKGDSTINIWFPDNFDVPGATKEHPVYIRIGSGDFYDKTVVRFDPAIRIARDGRLGDRLVQEDRNDWAPRLGIAWSPTPKWTLRAGVGVFFVQDTGNPRFDMSRNLSGRVTSSANTQINNLTFDRPFTVDSTVCGVPSPPFACVITPQGLANDYYRRTPYVIQYELNVQRQLNNNTVLEVGYLGSQGHKLERISSRNLPYPSTTGSVVSRQPVPEFGNIQFMTGKVSSNYHSMSAKLTRRMSGGLTYLAGYTFAKSIDNGSGIRTLGTDQLKPQDGICFSCERGLSIFDTRQRFVSSVLYDLPVGKGRRFINNGIASALIGGWQFGSIVTMSTGFPLNIATGRDQSNTGHGYDRPNAVAGQSVDLDSSQRITGRWFNTQAVVLQPLGTYGNLGRNVATGPGIFSVDFSTLKRFNITERRYLQFRFEAFNVLNHPNFGDPNTSLSANSFGTITDTRGGINMRELQFSLKLVF
jgi:hypothetical protein